MHLRPLFGLALLVSSPSAGIAGTVNWSQPGLNAQHTGYNAKETTISAANIGSLTQKWAVPIPNGIQGAAPIELNGIDYAQATDGTVYAVNATTSAVIWTYAGGHSLGLTGSGKIIYTTCSVDSIGHSGVCALNAATGGLIWSFGDAVVGGQVPTSSSPDNVPVVDHGMVFFGENYGGFNSPVSGDNLYALNAATGNLVWANAYGAGSENYGPFAIDKGSVFYAGPYDSNFSGEICAVNETDGLAMRCSPRFGGPASILSVSGGKVLALNSSQGNNTLFIAFDETSLAVAWQQTVSGGTSGYSYYPPAVAKGVAYFYSGENGYGSLYALSLTTGKQRWSYACNGASGSGCLRSGVSVANGVLFASCDKETIELGDQCAFDAKTGAELRLYGSTDGNPGTYSTPLVANGAVVGACGAYGGNLCQFAP
jgi:outer membrane protein assembly factor BamB